MFPVGHVSKVFRTFQFIKIKPPGIWQKELIAAGIDDEFGHLGQAILFGGLILAIIEGVGVIFTAVQAQNRTAQLAEQQKAQMEMYRQMGMNIGGPPPVAKSGDEAGSFMNDKYAQLSNLAPEAREQSYQF